MIPFLEIDQTVEGAEHLENQPCVYVVNHQSTLDLISVGAIMPRNTAIVGKKSLVYVPLLGWFIKMANNILVDRENHEQAMKTMEKAGRELRERKVSNHNYNHYYIQKIFQLNFTKEKENQFNYFILFF